MRIAICDDCLLFCQQLADLIAQEQPEPEQDSVLLFSSGELLLQQFEKKHPFDLIFLDIEMGQGLSGMETAAEIRRLDDTVMLVFVTAYPDFVFKAFDVQAMHYFVKPVEQQEFHRLFQRCRRKYYDESISFAFSDPQCPRAGRIAFVDGKRYCLYRKLFTKITCAYRLWT